MFDLLIILIFYLLFLSSVFGYGFLLTKIFNIDIQHTSVGLIGIYGIFSIIFFSYFTSILYPHDFVHNIILHSIGLIFCVIFFKKKLKNNFRYLYLFSLFFVFHILIFKNHDDFSYYHFPYTFYLTEFKTQLGVGIFSHGFRTPSSIFYLNSTFYLPFIQAYSFNLGALIIVVLSNLYFLDKIQSSLKISNYRLILFFSLLSLGLINIFFYRISEHGTDRSAQILILIIISEILIYLSKVDNKTFIKKYSDNLIGIFCLLMLIVSLKAFYVLYLILLLPIILKLYKNFHYFKISDVKKIISFSCLGILFVSFVFFSYFSNTGCVIYPIKSLCFENVTWGINIQDVVTMNNWYQLWSKAGASPNYIVDNPEHYIKGFNWIGGWLENYFFNKVSDFILGLLLMSVIFFLIFFEKKKVKNNFSRNIILMFVISVLFLEWFYNHPALRYGGYVIIALLFFLPLSRKLALFDNKISKLKKKVILTIILIFFISISRNIHRINHEINLYNYDIISSAFYSIDKQHLRISKKMNHLIDNKYKCDSNLECEQKNDFKIKKKYNRYIFYKAE